MYLNFFIFSAPANLRFGHCFTNSKIQEYFDPITCGINWNGDPNCPNGMTIKEKKLLDLVSPVISPNGQWQDLLLHTPDDSGYYCTNCPEEDENGYYYLNQNESYNYSYDFLK